MVELKGWILELFASAFVLYAAATVVGMLVSGPLVDRIGARRIVTLLLAPLALGLLALALSDNPAVALAFMLGAGMTNGAGLTLISALWAEMYGATHIGSIRSLVWTVIVVATAIAPVLFGALFDAGVSVEAIAAACLLAAIIAAFFAGPFRRLWLRSESA